MPKYRIELSDGRTFEVEADQPPSERDVLAALGNQQQAPAAPAEEPGAVERLLADNPAHHPAFRAVAGLGRLITRNPVQAGAMAGGAVAAPFTGGMSLPAAAAIVGGGSALGAGAGQLASGETPSVGAMAKEGALGATGQGAGRLITKGVGMIARPLAKGVLKVSRRIQDEFGLDDVLDTFFRERIPVGQSAKAGERMAESAGKAKQMATDAAAAGAPPVSPREIVREFRPLRDEVERRAANASPNAASQMREIVDRAKGLRRTGAQPVDRNQVLKQQAQTDANNAFRAADKGTAINDTTAKLDKAVAVGRQKAAETRIPGIADQNKRTQQLMGLEDALADVEARSPGFMGTNPATWLGAVAPGTGSRIALGAQQLSQAPIPGLLRNALLALFAQSEQEANRP